MLKWTAWTLLTLCVVVGAGAWAGWAWLMRQTEPTPTSKPFYVRFDDQVSLGTALKKLQSEGVVRDAEALRLYAKWRKMDASVGTGTYEVSGGMGRDEILAAFKAPVRQMVRFSERKWAARNAPTLEKHQVGSAAEYVMLVNQPHRFQSRVGFPLPARSLEGYLFPDTYDLPPLLGAEQTVMRQLKAFENKVYEGLGKPKNLHELVIIASMVELEVALDKERPIVAGVIKNRIDQGMLLQIDATILYGIGKWRTLTVDDYKNAISEYNTYLHKGLPPGPICSPGLASIKAAMNPAKHDYLYYVAIPDGSGRHLFARSLPEHRANVRRRHLLALKSKENPS